MNNKFSAAFKAGCVGAFVMLTIASGRNAWADTFQFSFTGAVTSVNDPNGYVSGVFHQGELVSGYVTYLSSASNQPPFVDSSTIGYYFAVESMTVQIGSSIWDYASSVQPGYMQVWNDLLVGSTVEDAAIFGSGFVGPIPVANTGMLNPSALATLSLVSPNISALSTTAIPSVQSLHGLIGPNSFLTVQQDDSRETLTNPMNFSVQSSVTAITQVPAPASGWLLAMTLASMIGIRAFSRACPQRTPRRPR